MGGQESTVGIVGAAGDLGTKLSRLVSANFDQVIAFDINTGSGDVGLAWSSDLDTLLETSDLVHWCAPISETRNFPRLADNQLLVLHDSVMANSHDSAARLKKKF